MATWQDIGIENFRAAVVLFDDVKSHRSATSRFYYASFCILTHELMQRHAGADFPDKYETPGHRQLPGLVDTYFTHFTLQRRANLVKYVKSLYRDRIASDYSLLRVDRQAAKDAYRAAEKIFQYLGVSHE